MPSRTRPRFVNSARGFDSACGFNNARGLYGARGVGRAHVLVACLLALAPACSKGHGEESAEKAEGTGEGVKDFVRFNPGSAPLDFIKVETVAETAAATSVTLPGRVSFDEDHTQRVASPIDGRAVSILAKLGDKVRAGQPLIELSSPNVGQLQADGQKSMSELALAQKALDRVHKLEGEGAVAEKEVA